MPQKIEGIYTPHMVPVDQRGDINEPELRRYITWLIDNGVHGLYPNGSTGEFLRFTPDERRRINQIVIDEARGRVPVLAGAAESNVRETIKACETYHGYGARAVDSGAALIGVNNRNLGTMKVTLDTSLSLADRLPSDVLKVSESGIETPEDIARLRAAGYYAFLVGERLMRNSDPGGAVRDLMASPSP